jgi:predicted DNA-binding protein
MKVTLDMPKEIEAQFTAAAALGVWLADYLRDFIVEHYQEDAEDLRTALDRLADPKPALTSSQLRKTKTIFYRKDFLRPVGPQATQSLLDQPRRLRAYAYSQGSYKRRSLLILSTA